MKVFVSRYLILVGMLSLVMPLALYGQNEDDIGRFLSAGKDDASKLIEAYTKPIVKSASYGMTGGWYTTAKPHKTFGFDFGVTISVANVPTSENYFDPNALGLKSSLTFNNTTRPSLDLAPTIVGPDDQTTYSFSGDLDGDGNADNTVSVPGPRGFDIKSKIKFAGMPVPMGQIGIGIIKNTDLKIRFVPKIQFGNSDFQMIGFGLMHDIKQHVKGIKLLPFDLSVLAAFNSVSGHSDMANNDPNTGPTSTDGELKYKFNSFVFQAIVSKKISVLTGYFGVGYSTVNTNVGINGTYTVQASPLTFDLKNPVSIDFKNKSMRVTAGIRLKLGPLYFVGDYTIQQYNALTVGLGFAFR